MTEQEILEHIKKLALKTKDDKVKLNSLIYLNECSKAKTFLEKNKIRDKEMSELLSKIFTNSFDVEVGG